MRKRCTATSAGPTTCSKMLGLPGKGGSRGEAFRGRSCECSSSLQRRSLVHSAALPVARLLPSLTTCFQRLPCCSIIGSPEQHAVESYVQLSRETTQPGSCSSASAEEVHQCWTAVKAPAAAGLLLPCFSLCLPLKQQPSAALKASRKRASSSKQRAQSL